MPPLNPRSLNVISIFEDLYRLKMAQWLCYLDPISPFASLDLLGTRLVRSLGLLELRASLEVLPSNVKD